MLKRTNLLVNFTKRGAAIWTKRVAIKPFQSDNCQPVTILFADNNFNFAKYYASKVQNDNDDNIESNNNNDKKVVNDQPEARKQHQAKPSPVSMVANVAEPLESEEINETSKAELEEIIRAHNENMDKLITSFQEQLNQHRERSQHQKLETQEAYQKMVDKLKNERPCLKQLPKLDFAKQVNEERDRKAAMEHQLLKDNDPKFLADEVSRLTKELEAEKEKNQQHADKYYGLMNLFNATKRNLIDKIDDEKLNAAKYALRSLLPIVDDLEEVDYTVSTEDVQGNSDEIQKLRKHMKFTYSELCSILGRHKVTEIDAIGNVFKHTVHQIAHESIDESIPPNTVISVEKKGYMIGNYCLRLAKVVVSRKKK